MAAFLKAKSSAIAYGKVCGEAEWLATFSKVGGGCAEVELARPKSINKNEERH